MTLEDILAFVDEEYEYLKSSYHADDDKEVLVRLAKAQEELGEFADEVLKSLGFARVDKLQAHSRTELE